MKRRIIWLIVFFILMAWLGYKLRKDEEGMRQAQREQDSLAAAYFDSVGDVKRIIH